MSASAFSCKSLDNELLHLPWGCCEGSEKSGTLQCLESAAKGNRNGQGRVLCRSKQRRPACCGPSGPRPVPKSSGVRSQTLALCCLVPLSSPLWVSFLKQLFLCIGLFCLHVYCTVHHTSAWCLQKSKEGLSSPGTQVTGSRGLPCCHGSAGNQTSFSANSKSGKRPQSQPFLHQHSPRHTPHCM